MTFELKMLAISIIIGLVQLVLAAQAATQQRGLQWNLSSRDQKVAELTGAGARLNRAFYNFLETFPLFVAAIALVHFTNRMGPLTTVGAALYVACRIIYIPIYAAGIPVVRTLIWAGSLIGIVLILVASFLA